MARGGARRYQAQAIAGFWTVAAQLLQVARGGARLAPSYTTFVDGNRGGRGEGAPVKLETTRVLSGQTDDQLMDLGSKQRPLPARSASVGRPLPTEAGRRTRRRSMAGSQGWASACLDGRRPETELV